MQNASAKRELIVMHLKNNSGCARCGKSCGCKINCHNYDPPRPVKSKDELNTFYLEIQDWYNTYWRSNIIMFDGSITFS